MDIEQTPMQPTSSVLYVLLGCWFGLLVGLAICCVFTPIGITYWTWTALRGIASVIRNSWQRFGTFRFGWSKHQKPPLPRSAYTWLRREVV